MFSHFVTVFHKVWVMWKDTGGYYLSVQYGKVFSWACPVCSTGGRVVHSRNTQWPIWAHAAVELAVDRLIRKYQNKWRIVEKCRHTPSSLLMQDHTRSFLWNLAQLCCMNQSSTRHPWFPVCFYVNRKQEPKTIRIPSSFSSFLLPPEGALLLVNFLAYM